MRKYLLTTAAFSNPELLEKCVKSWPRITRQAVFFDKLDANSELNKFYNDFYNHDYGLALGSEEHLGVSGAWNEILRFAFEDATFDAVIVVGSDTEMKEGFLENFIYEYEKQNLDFATCEYPIGWNCWVMNRHCYSVVGNFDENFYPCYWEDRDYWYRVTLSDIKYGRIDDKGLIEHYGSATIKLSNKYNQANITTFNMNKQYYYNKWGGVVGEEKVTTVKEWELNKKMYDYKKSLWA